MIKNLKQMLQEDFENIDNPSIDYDGDPLSNEVNDQGVDKEFAEADLQDLGLCLEEVKTKLHEFSEISTLPDEFYPPLARILRDIETMLNSVYWVINH